MVNGNYPSLTKFITSLLFYIKVNGVNLLNIPFKDANAYGRNLLDILFTKEEQKHSVVLATKKSPKPPLDRERVERLFGK